MGSPGRTWSFSIGMAGTASTDANAPLSGTRRSFGDGARQRTYSKTEG